MRSPTPPLPGETIGPSPWYFRDRCIPLGSRVVTWRDAGGPPPFSMCSVLGDSDQTALMVVGGMTYFRMLPEDRLLLWSPEVVPRNSKPKVMVFQLFDLAHLRQLSDVLAACTEIFESRATVVTTAPAIDQFGIPTTLAAGNHRTEFPEWMSEITELLVLVDGPDGSWDRGDRRVWSLCPRAGVLEVLPQDWFNNGGHDFGYEWITRVARDHDGSIVGDGIRISPFRLDATGRGVAAQLKRSPLGDQR